MIASGAALENCVRVGGRGLVRVEGFFDDGSGHDRLAHDLGKGLGLAQGPCVRPVRSAMRVCPGVQTCDCRADAERVSCGKSGAGTSGRAPLMLRGSRVQQRRSLK